LIRIHPAAAAEARAARLTLPMRMLAFHRASPSNRFMGERPADGLTECLAALERGGHS